mmetsp:Transcript_41053/g.49968  ORF Transcript_41053/g.49968 Transcript_41053/m.49968 type:complete len:247 (+) Transcript_41053:32-772(+)
MELLHLLISRNRDMLLAVVQARKQTRGSSRNHPGSSSPGSDRRRKTNYMSDNRSVTSESVSLNQESSQQSGSRQRGDNKSKDGKRKSKDRTDDSIAVQSELQRAFISMAKELYPIISNVIRSETPRWLKLCCHDGYFSSKTYRQTRLSMGEELFFFGDGSAQNVQEEQSKNRVFLPTLSFSSDGLGRHGSPSGSFSGSMTSRNSDNRRNGNSSHHSQTPSQSSMPVVILNNEKSPENSKYTTTTSC